MGSSVMTAMLRVLVLQAALSAAFVAPPAAGGEDAVRFWTQHLSHENPAVRKTAAGVLCTIGPTARESVPALLRAMKDEAVWVRAWAGTALAAVVPNAPAASLNAITAALSDDDTRVRQSAAHALGRLGHRARRAIPQLTALLGDENPWTRSAALSALEQVGVEGHTEVVPPVLALLKGDKASWYTGDAAAVLATVGPAALSALVEALEDEQTAREAARAIIRLGEKGKAAIPALLNAARTHPDIHRTLRQSIFDGFVAFGPDAIPHLAAALKDDDLRGWAIGALGCFTEYPDKVIPALLEELKHGPYPRAAAESLAVFGPAAKGAVPALDRLLNHKDPYARWDGIVALRKIKPLTPADIPKLVERLTESSMESGLYNIEALKHLGPGAAPALAGTLGSDGKDVRRRAAHTLGEFGPEAKPALPALRKLLRDEDVRTRVSAARAIWQIAEDTESAVPVLAAALKDAEWILRSAILRTLGEIGPAAREAVPAIRDVVAQKHFVTSLWGAVALGRIGVAHRDTVLLLFDLLALTRLGDHDSLAAVSALRRLGAPAVPVLREKLQGEDSDSRALAAHVLGEMAPGAADAIPDLIAALNDPVQSVRGSAVRALSRFGPAAAPAVPTLMDMLEREEDRRGQVASALAAIGPQARPALVLLIQLLERERHARTRRCIIQAIGAVGAGAATIVPVLSKALNDKEEHVRAEAAEALGKLGPAARAAVPLLHQALIGKEERYPRAYAVDALLRIDPSYAQVAIPVLIQGLDHGDPYRFLSSDALARIGAPAVLVLARVLDGERSKMHMRRMAVRTLRKIGPPAKAALPALRRAMRETERRDLRVRAAVALLHIAPNAEADVIRVLADELSEWSEGRLASRTLARVGPAAVPALVRVLNDGSRQVAARVQAAEALARIGPPAREVVPALTRALADLHLSVRKAARRALKQLRTEQNRRTAKTEGEPR